MTIRDGLVTLASALSFQQAVETIERSLAARGVAVLARIDHAAAAVDAGLVLRPTLLLIFGNPRVGTLLMQSEQAMGIDLPLKILIWQDAEDRVWVGYNDPHWLAARYGPASSAPILDGMKDLLEAVVQAAA